MGQPNPPVVVVTVGPTSTVVADLDVRSDELVTMQIRNLDPTQTFRGVVERRQSPEMEWSTTTVGDFNSIPPAGTVDADGNPLDSVTADLPVAGTGFLRVVGLMDGIGGDVSTCTRKGDPK